MPTEILPNLWLGQRPRSYDGFDVVVDCTSGRGRDSRLRLLADFSGVFLNVPMVDAEDFEPDMVAVESAAALAATEAEAGRRVLIHCAAGRNRSGLVCGLAVRKTLGCSGEEAVARMRELRDLTTGRNGSPVLSNERFKALVCLESQFPRPKMEEIGRSGRVA